METLKQVFHKITSCIKFVVTHLYSWVERGTVRVKCLVQEHNTMSSVRIKPRPLNPESSQLNMRILLAMVKYRLVTILLWECCREHIIYYTKMTVYSLDKWFHDCESVGLLYAQRRKVLFNWYRLQTQLEKTNSSFSFD